MPVTPLRARVLDDDQLTAVTELDEIMATLYAQGTRAQMIEAGLPLAARIARHYQGRGEPYEDLVQVATVGLIKAVDGYDAERGPFSHYAGPTVRGELKKHFRDRGWSVRVPRRLQELKIEISRAYQVLSHRLQGAPTVADLARYLEIDEDLVIEGLDLAHAYQPVSLDAPVPADAAASDLGALLGDLDPAVESLDDRMTLAALLPRLPEREQRILHLRFSGNMTQSEIAAEVGISQMHVSRLLAQALGWLREAMTADVTPVWPGAVGPDEPADALGVALHRLPGGTVVVAVTGEVDHDTGPAGLRPGRPRAGAVPGRERGRRAGGRTPGGAALRCAVRHRASAPCGPRRAAQGRARTAVRAGVPIGLSSVRWAASPTPPCRTGRGSTPSAAPYARRSAGRGRRAREARPPAGRPAGDRRRGPRRAGIAACARG
jgi:RNA polymerase sigma-B factor